VGVFKGKNTPNLVRLSTDDPGYYRTKGNKKASVLAGFLIFTGFHWTVLENEMVEAAGIEPASGNSPPRTATCLAPV